MLSCRLVHINSHIILQQGSGGIAWHRKTTGSTMMKAIAVFVLCFFALAYAQEGLTACQEDRARRINSTIDATDNPALHLIPECDENGDYAALQCYTNNDWCVCYRRNGENINTPSKSIKSCDCVRARDDAQTSGAVGGFVPTCRKDGYYAAKQCLNDECWCVDRNGKSSSEPTSDLLECRQPE